MNGARRARIPAPRPVASLSGQAVRMSLIRPPLALSSGDVVGASVSYGCSVSRDNSLVVAAVPFIFEQFQMPVFEHVYSILHATRFDL